MFNLVCCRLLLQLCCSCSAVLDSAILYQHFMSVLPSTSTLKLRLFLLLCCAVSCCVAACSLRHSGANKQPTIVTQGLIDIIDRIVCNNAKPIAKGRPHWGYTYVNIKDSAHPAMPQPAKSKEQLRQALSEVEAHLAESNALRAKIVAEEHALNQALIASVKAEFGL
jgi:hypothetical protein